MRLTLLLVLISFSTFGQNYIESFDECTFNPGTQVFGNPTCDCGVEGDGLELNGSTDYIHFKRTDVNTAGIDKVLENDFTLDFHFKIVKSDKRMNIFSIAQDDQFTNSFTIKYEPGDNSIVTQLSNSIADLKTVKFELPTTFCWIRYTLTKNGPYYALYYNNKIVEAWEAETPYIFSEIAPIAIGNGPSIGQFETRFKGMVDDFKVYNRALTPLEINENTPMADRIISRDTTIIKGNEVEIFTGNICSSNFSWNNPETLDDPRLENPTASPDETTSYVLSVRDNTCLTRDTITVHVVNKKDIECQNIYLPKAFSPNNDGLNDIFGISSLYLLEDIQSFEIYDRWHNLLWETNNKNDKWNGTYNGTPCQPGTYLYKINYTCSGKEYSKVDNFVIIR